MPKNNVPTRKKKLSPFCAYAWNPEAGILGLNIDKDDLKNIEQILTNQKYY